MSRAELGTPRKADGRYGKHPACDACGKPALDYCTDDDVCQGSDGPGFVVCERKRCLARVEKVNAGRSWTDAAAIEARRALYTRQRAENETALEAGRNPKSVPLEG